MKKTNYKLKKKYDNGTQSINPNIDPTTQYQNNRAKNSGSVQDMEFNNSQQALTNRGIQQQQLQDNTNNTLNQFSNNQVNSQAKRSSVTSTLSKAGPYGTALGALMSIGGGIGDSQNAKAYNQALNGQNTKGTQEKSVLLTDTGSKLLNAKSATDVGEAFIPIHGLFGKDSQDIAQEKAVQAQKQQKNTTNQINQYGAVDTSSQATQVKEGSSGIHIKPENKGKFTAYKQRTGKTTEEALHSKDAHVRQMANFAKNAKSWDHKEKGSKDLVLNNLIKSHSKSYKMIESKESPKVEKQELGEFKKLKKLENNTREIETEGREPIFSPKKKDGSRDLLYYNPSDPTHETGGVKAKVVKSNTYNMKSGNSELTIPEGSAIVTANKGKNKEALVAYRNKDYKKLDKLINKMPNDSKSKKYAGVDNVKGKGSLSASDEVDNSNPEVGSGLTSNLSSGSLGSASTSNNNFMDRLGNSTNTLGTLSPTLFNLAQGLSKPQLTNRNYINNANYKYVDSSGPAKRAANEAQLVNFNNIRNATGGSGGAFLANQAEASAQRFKNISDINNQQMEQKNNINNSNVDLRNQQNQANVGLANEYNQMDKANRAKKTEYIGKGLEGLSQYSQMNQLNKNRDVSDNVRLNLLKSNNYQMNNEGDTTIRSKKGLKNIKYKMKQ